MKKKSVCVCATKSLILSWVKTEYNFLVFRKEIKKKKKWKNNSLVKRVTFNFRENIITYREKKEEIKFLWNKKISI